MGYMLLLRSAHGGVLLGHLRGGGLRRETSTGALHAKNERQHHPYSAM